MSQPLQPIYSSDRDELTIIDAICRGEHALFHDLIRPYEKPAYKIAFSLLRNEADAEDAVQEAFLRAFRKLGSFRMESRFSTWLISIVLNEARGRLRKKKRMPLESIDAESTIGTVYTALADRTGLPSELFEQKQMADFLSRAIADLPGIYRDVFLLRAVKEQSVRESAQILGVTQAAIKARMFRARVMLKRKLQPSYRPQPVGLAVFAGLESA